MTDNTQDINQKIETKKLTVKQLELQLKRLEHQQLKAKEKLAKQIEREKEKEQKNQARKLRNKKIYDWGGLIPLIFGAEEFDKISDDVNLKNALIGLLIKAKQELSTNGFGLTADNKQNWLEFYKNQGKKFLDERNNG
ncbi:hypothetical protein [uncultured Agitococcus sp.]|uniref:hypothetical protein n=1 Tax=uncultured Agitococcus sp. TaxID=1506599 RepID=UPI00261D5461|nr:hypothetical protein [uncultured Agitococcus sp.]